MSKSAFRGSLTCTLLASAACIGLADVQSAYAQVSQPVARSEDEIVVTARRRSENLQSVPVAVTALTQEAITALNITGPADLNANVPSLGVSNTSPARDALKYVIRGMGEAPFGAEPAVVNYFAEVPTTSVGPGLLFDLENIQVLKGPQGTLFGRNTTGGALLIEPRRPSNELGGYASFSLGDYDLTRLEAAVNVPIVDDRLLVRAAVDMNARDGFTTELNSGLVLDDRDYQSYRLGVTFRPNDWLENYLVGYWIQSDTNGSGTRAVALNPNSLAAQFFPTSVTDFATLQALGIRYTFATTPPSDQSRSIGVTNTTTFNLSDNLVLKNIFGYREYRHRLEGTDGFTAPLVDGVNFDNAFTSGGVSAPSSRRYTDELQLQGAAFDERLNWILGAYYEESRPYSSSDKDSFNQFGTSPIVLQSLKYDESTAVFAQGTYAATPDLNVTVGLRQTWDTRQQIATNYAFTPAFCLFTTPVPNCIIDIEDEFEALTGNLSLDYSLSDDTMVYVASRRGYKSGGFSVAAPNPADRAYDSEFVTDVEFGLKTDFQLGTTTGRLNIALYRSWFEALQVSGLVFDAPSSQVLSITTNAGDGYIQGFELEGSIRPMGGDLELSGFYTYTDPEYTDATFNNGFELVDMNDVPFTNVPEHKLSFNALYEWPLAGADETLSFRANYTYQSEVFFLVPIASVNTDPQVGQDAYGLVNLRADWNRINGGPVSLGVFATNVTDEEYKVFENSFYDLVGFTDALYGEPRMVGAQLRVEFGGG